MVWRTRTAVGEQVANVEDRRWNVKMEKAEGRRRNEEEAVEEFDASARRPHDGTEAHLKRLKRQTRRTELAPDSSPSTALN